MPGKENFQLQRDPGFERKKVTPAADYKQRMLRKYDVNPDESPEELKRRAEKEDEEERKKMARECGLEETATWKEINEHNRDKARAAWAIANGLPPESTNEQINTHILEEGRKREAEKLGLPSDTTWETITLKRMFQEEQRDLVEKNKKRKK